MTKKESAGRVSDIETLRVVERETVEGNVTFDKIANNDTLYVTFHIPGHEIITGAITESDDMYGELLNLFPHIMKLEDCAFGIGVRIKQNERLRDRYREHAGVRGVVIDHAKGTGSVRLALEDGAQIWIDPEHLERI